MAYAVVVQVRIEPGSDIEHRHAILNNLVIPQVRALPSFLRGSWLNDGAGTGTCIWVFRQRGQREGSGRAANADEWPGCAERRS